MKKKPIDQFKELIKGCVRDVIREELQVLTENKQTITPTVKRNLQEELSKKFNPNINPSKRTGDRPDYLDLPTTGDPLLDILNETKHTMSSEDYQSIGNFGSPQAQGFSNYNGLGGEVPVGNTSDMLSTAKASRDINQVSIDVVPDYSQMMKAMGGK